MEHDFGRFAIPNMYVFHITAALLRSLDFNAAERAFDIAVPYLHILDAAGYFASDDDAVSERTDTVKHPDVPARPVDKIAFRIFPGFYGDTVILRKKETAENRAVSGRIRIPSVSVPDAFRIKSTAMCHDIV